MDAHPVTEGIIVLFVYVFAFILLLLRYIRFGIFIKYLIY